MNGDLRTLRNLHRQSARPRLASLSRVSRSVGLLHSAGCLVKTDVGSRWGMLTVEEVLPNGRRRCLCDCGNRTVVEAGNLTKNNTSSCGCQQLSGVARTSWVGRSPLEDRIGEFSMMWELVSVPRLSARTNIRCVICGHKKTVPRRAWPYRIKCKDCRSLRAIVDDEEFASLPTVTDAQGYVRFVCGRYDLRGAGSHGHIGAHRLIVERYIGRPLEGAEEVHHINGDRSDNRIENLALCAGRAEHATLEFGPPIYSTPYHNRFSRAFAVEWQYTETCPCGCGTQFPAFRLGRGRAHLRQFVRGHKNRLTPRSRTPSPSRPGLAPGPGRFPFDSLAAPVRASIRGGTPPTARSSGHGPAGTRQSWPTSGAALLPGGGWSQWE